MAKASDLAQLLTAELVKYAKATGAMVEDAEKQVAQKAVRKLRLTSPKQKNGGDYAKSWTYKRATLSTKVKGVVIYSRAPHYRLTHLLENGHRIVRNGVDVGWSDAIPHITSAADTAVRELESEIISRIKNNDLPDVKMPKVPGW